MKLALVLSAAALALSACGHTDAGNTAAGDNADVLVNSDEGEALNTSGLDELPSGNASGLDNGSGFENATAPLDAGNETAAGNAQ